MKKVINFSRFFAPAAVISCLLVAFGLFGFFTKGFTLGVDFQAGLMQEVQFAPAAFSIRWLGTSNAILSSDRNGVYIVISGSGIESQTYSFRYADYATAGSLARAMMQQLGSLDITIIAGENTDPQNLIFSSYMDSYLGSDTPLIVHYLDPQSGPIDINEVRNAMAAISQGVSVQSAGSRADRKFMIRIEDREDAGVSTNLIIRALEDYFGPGEVAVLSSDYVGSRFSKDLTDQALMLLGLTLIVIFIYAAIRFKLKFALGAVVAIIHDALIVIAFVVWTQMEFTTSTIAAILTILGYSINNTIVVFDRIRENRRLLPDRQFTDILNISLSNVLGRSVITTLTTILAVIFLFVFATGSMKDFALALIVGMVSGVYTTLFISSGFVNFLENRGIIREKKQ